LKEDEEGGLGIAETPFVEPTPPVIAIVRRQNHGKRYQVIDPRRGRVFDDRLAEILGMAFVPLPELRTKARTARVVLPREGFNFPVSEARELGKRAESGDIGPEFWGFVNRVPAIAPNGRVVNPFANLYVVDSIKNFAFYNEQGELVFMLYKSAEGAFIVKGKDPFTPLTAFALSLAIISG
jgi:hypothetical protein